MPSIPRSPSLKNKFNSLLFSFKPSNRNRSRHNFHFLPLLIPSFSKYPFNNTKIHYSKYQILPYLKKKRFESLTFLLFQGNSKFKNMYIKHVFFSRVLITFVIQILKEEKGEERIGIFNEDTVGKNNGEITRIIWKNPVSSLLLRLISESVDKVKMIKRG